MPLIERFTPGGNMFPDGNSTFATIVQVFRRLAENRDEQDNALRTSIVNGDASALADAQATAAALANDAETSAKSHATQGDQAVTEQARAYTDASFAASAPGGATDATVDAAVERARLAGRVLTEVNDAAVAAHLTNTGSESAAAQTNATLTLFRQVDAYHVRRSDLVPGADNRNVIQAAVNAAAADGVRVVKLPRGEITLGAQVTIPGTAHGLRIEGHGEDTVVRQIAGAVNQALFYGAGSDGTKYPLTADHAAGVTTVTVPAELASTLTVGSLLGLECTTLVYGVGSNGQESRASEIRPVVAVSGTTVTVDGPLIHDYTVAATAVAWKMNPLTGVSLADFVLTSTDPATIKARNIYLIKARDTLLSGIHLMNAGGGIYLNDVIGSMTANINADGLPNVGNFLGYGVAVGGRSAHAMIEGLRGRNLRHLFTTLADERTANSVVTQWGGPRHVTVRGGVGEARRTGTQYSIWDTHPYGYDVVFDNCRAFGGSSPSSCGFQIRSKKTKILNGTALYSGKSGVRVDPVTADDVEVNGGEFAFCTEGMALGRNTRVHGAWMHDNNGPGAIISIAATRSHIFGNVIENNTYGLHDQSAGEHTGVVAQGNTIPRSAKQTLSIVSPKSDLAFVGNVVPGYGAGNDGVGGTPASTVKRLQNITD